MVLTHGQPLPLVENALYIILSEKYGSGRETWHWSLYHNYSKDPWSGADRGRYYTVGTDSHGQAAFETRCYTSMSTDPNTVVYLFIAKPKINIGKYMLDLLPHLSMSPQQSSRAWIVEALDLLGDQRLLQLSGNSEKVALEAENIAIENSPDHRRSVKQSMYMER